MPLARLRCRCLPLPAPRAAPLLLPLLRQTGWRPTLPQPPPLRCQQVQSPRQWQRRVPAAGVDGCTAVQRRKEMNVGSELHEGLLQAGTMCAEAGRCNLLQDNQQNKVTGLRLRLPF